MDRRRNPKPRRRWRSLIKRIRNITFVVSNLKDTIHFCESIISLKEMAQWPNNVTFDAGGFDLAFEPGGKKGGKISHRKGAPDVFMEVDDVDDVYRRQREGREIHN